MIDISIFLPFRERLNFFAKLMDSLKKTTTNPERVELVIAIDKDDTAVINQIGPLVENNLPFDLRFLLCDRGEHMIKTYINPAARICRGRFLLASSDDAVFKTAGWDRILYQKMDDAFLRDGDDIHLGLINDGINRTGEDPLFPRFSCWPVLGREMLLAKGNYIYHEHFNFWGLDWFLADVFRRMKRLVSITDVLIDHYSVHTGQRPRDENYERFAKVKTIYDDALVTEETQRLVDLIFEIRQGGKNA